MATPVKSPSSRAVQAERTRQQILETARRLFAERGYDATSLQMIADEMGLTKAAVYYHFRAKGEILDAIMLPGVQRLEALLDEAAAIRGRRARLEFLVSGFVDFLVKNLVASRPVGYKPLKLRGQPGPLRRSAQSLDVHLLEPVEGEVRQLADRSPVAR